MHVVGGLLDGTLLIDDQTVFDHSVLARDALLVRVLVAGLLGTGQVGFGGHVAEVHLLLGPVLPQVLLGLNARLFALARTGQANGIRVGGLWVRVASGAGLASLMMSKLLNIGIRFLPSGSQQLSSWRFIESDKLKKCLK